MDAHKVTLLFYRHEGDFFDDLVLRYLKKVCRVYTIGKKNVDILTDADTDVQKNKLELFIKRKAITHFFYCENYSYFPLMIDKLDASVKKVMYLIDTNISVKKRVPYLQVFDIVFTVCPQFIPELKKFNPHVFQTLYGVDTDFFYKQRVKKVYDVIFVGNIIPWVHYDRFFLLLCLKIRGVKLYYTKTPYTHINTLFNKSKIVLNKLPRDGFNMRIFEALGSGSLLMNDFSEKNGMTKILKDKKQLVYYHSFNDLYHKITYYLNREAEREEIAKRGNTFAVRHLTWLNTAQKMTTTLRSCKPTRNKRSPQAHLAFFKINTYLTRDSDKALVSLRRAHQHGEISRVEYYIHRCISMVYFAVSDLVISIIEVFKQV